MAKQQRERPGARWQPVVGRVTNRRRDVAPLVAGRLRWRPPSLRLPSLGAGWGPMALSALAGAALTFAAVGAYESSLIRLRGVSVEGTQLLSQEQVLGVADLGGETFIRPDFDGARERLLALPAVKDVEVGRDWPLSARITIVERTPWGVWQIGPERVVIDDEGVVLDAPAPEGGPLIVDIAVGAAPVLGEQVDRGAVEVARRLVPTSQQTVGRRVVRLEFSAASGLTAVLAAPGQLELRALFGDAQDYDFKVAALYSVLRRIEGQGGVVTGVDLRFGDAVAVQGEVTE